MVLQRKAPAKLNLFLKVLGKRQDGYHELETVMVPISLVDRLEMEKNATNQIDLEVVLSGSLDAEQSHNGDEVVRDIPTGSDNLVVKVLEEFLKQNQLTDGIKIKLVKWIPAGGGLGGSSSDAAACLLLANKLLDCNWTIPQLQEFSARFGSDIAFFFQDSSALCTGRGEKISPLKTKFDQWLVLYRPDFGLSTPEVFSNLSINLDSQISSDSFVKAFESRERRAYCEMMCNDLAEPAMNVNDGLREVSKEFARTDSMAHQMTGSGSCYFGVYRSKKHARRTAKLLHNRLRKSCWICHGI